MGRAVSDSDRRRAPRRAPFGDEPLSRVRLRGRRELDVVNVSRAGVLVEGAVRLLPGVHVDVHVTTAEGRVLLRSRVVRAFVWSLAAHVVTYRGALAFPQPSMADRHGYGLPQLSEPTRSMMGSAYPQGAS